MTFMEPAAWNDVVQVSVPVLGLLLAGNMYFGMRLLKRIDKMDETVTSTFPVYNSRLATVETKAASLSDDMKEVANLRERVAVLEFAHHISRTT